jgi:MoxR-like ATPase
MQYLLLGGKARAMLNGRFFVTTDDIRAVAHPVLRHRVITNFNAESSGISSDKVVDRLLVDVPERRPGDEVVPELKRAFGS